MDALSNPYTPGAGSRPRELAGRDDEIELFETLLGRMERGNHERSIIIHGLRGVGKTVLLNEFEERAATHGWAIGATEGRTDLDLRVEVSRMVQEALLDISVKAKVKDSLRRVVNLLRAFTLSTNDAGGLDLSVDLSVMSDAPSALERDLVRLLVELGQAALDNGTGVVFFIDEMQLLKKPDLEALIAAVHRTGQKTLPIALVGAGLPGLPGKLADAKSYAERLFAYRQLGALAEDAARRAIERPAATALGTPVGFEPEAVNAILDFSEGYPVFIQAHGKHAWNVALGDTITLDDVNAARPEALKELDAELFLSRIQRTTPKERRYLAAMGDLGEGPYSSAEVARHAGYPQPSSASPVRQSLIDKGMIYSPEHGEVAFTVPHFADYMRREHPLASLQA